MFKKFLWASAIAAGLTSAANAQPALQDVAVEIPSNLFQAKLSKGSVKAKFSVLNVYYGYFTDPRQILKAKATANVSVYLSSDTTISEDDRLLIVKKVSLKGARPKFTKVSATFAPSDSGKYLIASVVSPNDNYPVNDQTHLWLDPSYFGNGTN